MIHKIIITCPKCGSEQEEPSAVLSAYCRSCRSHLDLERDGVAWRNLAPPSDATLLQKVKGFLGKRPTSRQALPREPQRPKVRTATVPTATSADSPEAESVPDKPEPAAKKKSAPRPGPAAEAKIEPRNEPGAGRATKFRSERTLICYACEKPFAASKLGPAPACPHCSEFFVSTDKVIEEPSEESVFTYGNVRVLSRGALTGGKLRCHHLAAYGALAGDIQCSGRVECNASGTMDATLRCRELIIPRKVSIEFTGLVMADRIEVQGEITARALINGDLRVDSAGIFNGEVVTRTMSVEDDAELNAAVQIDTDPLSLREQFENPAPSAG